MISIENRPRLAAYLQRDLALHLYELGDLDDFFYPHTRWYGLEKHGELQAVVLRYQAAKPEVLLALAAEADLPSLRRLLYELLPYLPETIYAHLSPGLEKILETRYTLKHHGLHWKMQLIDPAQLPTGPFPLVSPLGNQDILDLDELYNQHYPGHAFDPRMLATGRYLGIRLQGRLVCAAGVHVYSPRYSVAALGNVVTDNHYRGQGLARNTVSALCHLLLEEVRHIGLNVRADNLPAVQLYESLGFRQQAEYHEYTLSRMEI